MGQSRVIRYWKQCIKQAIDLMVDFWNIRSAMINHVWHNLEGLPEDHQQPVPGVRQSIEEARRIRRAAFSSTIAEDIQGMHMSGIIAPEALTTENEIAELERKPRGR